MRHCVHARDDYVFEWAMKSHTSRAKTALKSFDFDAKDVKKAVILQEKFE